VRHAAHRFVQVTVLPARHVRVSGPPEGTEVAEKQPDQQQQAQRLPVVDACPSDDSGDQRVPQPHRYGYAQRQQGRASEAESCGFQFFFHVICLFW